jgi:hypothetical protein
MQQVFVAGGNWLQDLLIIIAAIFGWIKELAVSYCVVCRHIYAGIFIKAISRQIRQVRRWSMAVRR